jgi:hypothetical protein
VGLSKLARAGAGGLGCFLGAVLLLVAQLGGSGTPSSRAIDQVKTRATRPGPGLPPPPAASPGPVWVPDRIAPAPLAPLGVRIPGHWEQPFGPGQYYVPPLNVCDQATGICAVVPGGVQGPVEQRPLPQDPAVTRGGTTVTSP